MLADEILKHLPFEPNWQQLAVVGSLGEFCTRPVDHKARAFILNGYAGTGKTSLLAALVKALKANKISAKLMAPTGRAAKVLSGFAGAPASTIHRGIYRHSIHGEVPALKQNKLSNAVFIVDEASMIPASSGNDDLLSDLISYVFSTPGNRLIFLGDTAQLPPVGADFSPAMNPEVLKKYGIAVSRATLTLTARQAKGSGILFNATALRKALREEAPKVPQVVTKPFNDVILTERHDLVDALETAYSLHGTEGTVVITRSNRDAALYNAAIRAQVLFHEEELAPGELIVVAKNNYAWTTKTKAIDFIANGDILKVVRVLGREEKYGFYFADVELTLPDGVESFPAKVMLSTLKSEAAALPASRLEDLIYFINQEAADAAENPQSSENSERPLTPTGENPYLAALQIKYAYAVTCHKAQGGQWEHVFVDAGHVPPDADIRTYLRWLYTAVTRSSKTLTLITP